jgi:hypothetical protein
MTLVFKIYAILSPKIGKIAKSGDHNIELFKFFYQGVVPRHGEDPERREADRRRRRPSRCRSYQNLQILAYKYL